MGVPGWYQRKESRVNRYFINGRPRRRRFLLCPIFLDLPGVPFLERICVSIHACVLSLSLSLSLSHACVFLRYRIQLVLRRFFTLLFFFLFPRFCFYLDRFVLFYTYSVTGAMGICFPYLGEFQPTKYRERCLCWMEMFWTVGVIVLPRKFHFLLSPSKCFQGECPREDVADMIQIRKLDRFNFICQISIETFN